MGPLQNRRDSLCGSNSRTAGCRQRLRPNVGDVSHRPNPGERGLLLGVDPDVAVLKTELGPLNLWNCRHHADLQKHRGVVDNALLAAHKATSFGGIDALYKGRDRLDLDSWMRDRPAHKLIPSRKGTAGIHVDLGPGVRQLQGSLDSAIPSSDHRHPGARKLPRVAGSGVEDSVPYISLVFDPASPWLGPGGEDYVLEGRGGSILKGQLPPAPARSKPTHRRLLRSERGRGQQRCDRVSADSSSETRPVFDDVKHA